MKTDKSSNILIIDASSERLYALVADASGRVLAAANVVGTRAHSSAIMPAVAKSLKDAGTELSGICCVCACVGPGSFTGIRVGISTAGALAFAAKLPLVSFTSLHAYAYFVSGGTTEMQVTMDAGRGLFYHAGYNGLKTTAEPQLITAAEAEALTAEGRAAAFDAAADLSGALACLAAQKFAAGEFCEQLEAVYLRKPQAQEELERKS